MTTTMMTAAITEAKKSAHVVHCNSIALAKSIPTLVWWLVAPVDSLLVSRALFAIFVFCIAIFYFKISHSVEPIGKCTLLINRSGQCHMHIRYGSLRTTRTASKPIRNFSNRFHWSIHLLNSQNFRNHGTFRMPMSKTDKIKRKQK